MLSLSSTAQAAAAVRGARAVDFEAYVLRPGELLDALEAAARGGARVRVRLEGAPCGNAARANRFAVAELRRSGADARLSLPPQAPLHAKALVADGALYLDDRNWGNGDLVLRDDDPHDPCVARHKRSALESEAELLRTASGGGTIVESESFGCGNPVYAAVDDAAELGLEPRVLVCARELRGNRRESAMLERLVRDGARVRVTQQTDKIALAGERAWIGSANATAAFAPPDALEWSVCSGNAAIVAAARARVEDTWSRARPLHHGS
jgi:hypothetical protein